MSESTTTQSETTSGDQDPAGQDPNQTEVLTSQSDGPASGDQTIEEITVQPAEGAQTYTNPLLKGKSPEEIQRLFETTQAAVTEQNAELNRTHAELQDARKQASAPAPGETTPTEGAAELYGDDFLSPRFKTLEGRVAQMLEKAIEPLKAATAKSETSNVRGRLRTVLKHFNTLEPHIDTLLRDQNINPTEVTESQLTMLYHTAVGLAAEKGINLGEADQPSRDTTMSIPQHRPSSAQLPETEKTPRRKLTENEKRLAREFFGDSKDPEGDYLSMQSADMGEVVEPGFSKEGW